MKYKWRRYWLWVILLVAAISLLSVLNATNNISTQVFVGLSLTCIASFISIIAHFQNSDKFFKELFTEFNCRYDRLNNFLNSIKEDQKLTTEERQKIIDLKPVC